MQRHQRADKTGGSEADDRDEEAPVSTRPVRMPIHTYAVDDIAMMALRERTHLTAAQRAEACDVCGGDVDEDATSGLFMWVRDDDLRFDEPPICSACAANVSAQAYLRFLLDD